MNNIESQKDLEKSIKLAYTHGLAGALLDFGFTPSEVKVLTKRAHTIHKRASEVNRVKVDLVKAQLLSALSSK